MECIRVLFRSPVTRLDAPIPATARALERTGMRIDDFDLYEINEAFASIPLAWLRATGADPDRLNVNGGAIALGHPLGASGTKLMSTLIYALKARGGRYGLQVMCERSEEHTSELQSLMRISYAVFCLKKKNIIK